MAPLRSSSSTPFAVSDPPVLAVIQTTAQVPSLSKAPPVRTDAAHEPPQVEYEAVSPTLRVFATRELFETIVNCVPGIPKLLIEFVASSQQCAYASTRSLSPFVSFAAETRDTHAWSPCYDPQSVNGSLVRLALEQDNREVLALVLRLHRFLHYHYVRQLRLDMAVVWAVELGRVQTLQWFLPRLTGFPHVSASLVASTPLLAAAIASGDVKTLDYVHDSFVTSSEWSDEAIGDALARTPRDCVAAVVQWLCAHCRPSRLSSDAVNTLAARGCLRALECVHHYVDAHDHPITATKATGLFAAATMDTAARHGHIDVVRFLHFQRSEGCTTAALDNAAANGHLDVVQFLHNHRSEGGTVAAVDMAAANGHLEVVQYLFMHRHDGCTPAAMDHAARYSHIDVVQFLHKNHALCTTLAMDYAASNGHLAVVHFLHANRREGCTKRALSLAAQSGYVAVVRFLLEHRREGCAEDALQSAVRSGRFEVARYLHSRGFMGDVAKCVVSCCCSVVSRYY